MSDGMTTENRQRLINALLGLATAIEQNPPTIIGSDIYVQASGGGRVVGSSISVVAGPDGVSGTGQRITVIAQPGQSVIGQRITVVAGSGPVQLPAPGASSQSEITEVVTQLRDAADTLALAPASKGWVTGMLAKVSGWGSSALSGAVSGAMDAATSFYLNGG